MGSSALTVSSWVPQFHDLILNLYQTQVIWLPKGGNFDHFVGQCESIVQWCDSVSDIGLTTTSDL